MGRLPAGREPMTSSQTAELLTEVQELIHEREREGVAGLADRAGPAEWADLVPLLEPAEVAVLLQWLPDEEVPTLLEELPPSEAARILRTLAAPEAARLLEDIDPDDAADIVEQLPGPHADQILIRMRPSEAAEIRELSLYPRDSAGGIMTPAFVAVPRDATANEAIGAIRRLVDQAETVNYVYVVDDERRLLGVLSLYRLILSRASTPVSDLMAPTTVRVRGGKRTVTDGPFAETKEQLGGYFLVDAANLDEAIAIAGRIPSARSGSIEVRPLVTQEAAQTS